MIPAVSTSPLGLEKQTPSIAIVAMSLKLAGARDPDLLLKGVSQVVREIISSQWVCVGILDEDGDRIRLFFDGMDNPVRPSMAVLKPGLLAKMLVDRRAVRLRSVITGSLGFAFLPGDSPLASVLAVPLSGSRSVRGFLFFAIRLAAEEFGDEDEQIAVVLANQLTLAYERMEEQKRADEELAESREVLEVMFESAPDAIAAVNENGRIVKVNAQTQNLFGYAREELVGQPVEILVPERFRAAHPTRRQQYSAHPRRRPMGEGLELFGRRKDSSEFPVDIMLSPLETKRGKLMLSVIRDATARKQNKERTLELNLSLEKHVEELQAANQELETFSYSVSHDLRAPLRQVDGFARILRERIGLQCDPDTSHYLQRIQDGATHMGCLLEGLLDMGRLGRQGLRVRLTDLGSLASQVVEELKLDVPNRQIEWILNPLPVMLCDAVLVKAVFSNLLSNAVKFTALRECAIIQLGQKLENGEVVIEVADNGVGFNMKYADKLFGIFQRLHRSEDFPGTGMGLATVQRIIKKHGGRIWAEAALNSYAKFSFTLLPRSVEQTEESKQETEVLQ
jgi:PAS domain S-box-containing protein